LRSQINAEQRWVTLIKSYIAQHLVAPHLQLKLIESKGKVRCDALCPTADLTIYESKIMRECNENINFTIFSFSKKLLAPMSTRVPLEIQELVDDLAEGQGSDRAKWLREAIDLKIELETGQSSIEALKNQRIQRIQAYSRMYTKR
jgi:predicted DNA-binding protein